MPWRAKMEPLNLSSDNSGNLPELTSKDMVILGDIRKSKPMAFYYNATKFYLGEMWDYVKDARCWRSSIMGETRGGKSEVGQSISLMYCRMFNQLLKQGNFDSIDVFKDEIFAKNDIKLDVEHICSNQSNYIYALRENQKNNRISFGQIWIIDESRKSIGGVGSFSELLDLKNVNNIIAKFMQAEIWIQPLQFEANNCPYGLYVFKKDVINRVNWCLLYRMSRTPTGGMEYVFMGWVKIPLHKDENLRKIYNQKKNSWIINEMEGTADERMVERKRIAMKLSKDKDFAERTTSGKQFMQSKSQQITMLEDWIIKKKTQNWNQVEKMMIVEEARRLAENIHREAQDAETDKVGLDKDFSEV
jgi:hypothetical protein